MILKSLFQEYTDLLAKPTKAFALENVEKKKLVKCNCILTKRGFANTLDIH
jgi:hypothetical protein